MWTGMPTLLPLIGLLYIGLPPPVSCNLCSKEAAVHCLDNYMDLQIEAQQIQSDAVNFEPMFRFCNNYPVISSCLMNARVNQPSTCSDSDWEAILTQVTHPFHPNCQHIYLCNAEMADACITPYKAQAQSALETARSNLDLQATLEAFKVLCLNFTSVDTCLSNVLTNSPQCTDWDMVVRAVAGAFYPACDAIAYCNLQDVVDCYLATNITTQPHWSPREQMELCDSHFTELDGCLSVAKANASACPDWEGLLADIVKPFYPTCHQRSTCGAEGILLCLEPYEPLLATSSPWSNVNGTTTSELCLFMLDIDACINTVKPPYEVCPSFSTFVQVFTDPLYDMCKSFLCDGVVCPTGYCVPRDQVCDGHIHCYASGEPLDEMECDTCHGHAFHCARSGQCVPGYAVCNGQSDCLGGEDEVGCCGPDMAACDDGSCVPRSSLCDQKRDCPHGEDEDPSKFGLDCEVNQCFSTIGNVLMNPELFTEVVTFYLKGIDVEMSRVCRMVSETVKCLFEVYKTHYSEDDEDLLGVLHSPFGPFHSLNLRGLTIICEISLPVTITEGKCSNMQERNQQISGVLSRARSEGELPDVICRDLGGVLNDIAMQVQECQMLAFVYYNDITRFVLAAASRLYQCTYTLPPGILPEPIAMSLAACDAEQLSLTCAPGQSLNITSAHYGHQEADVLMCPGSGDAPDGASCTSNEALSKVKAACQDQANCTLKVGPDTFTDSCSTTGQGLSVTYTCQGLHIGCHLGCKTCYGMNLVQNCSIRYIKAQLQVEGASIKSMRDYFSHMFSTYLLLDTYFGAAESGYIFDGFRSLWLNNSEAVCGHPDRNPHIGELLRVARCKAEGMARGPDTQCDADRDRMQVAPPSPDEILRHMEHYFSLLNSTDGPGGNLSTVLEPVMPALVQILEQLGVVNPSGGPIDSVAITAMVEDGLRGLAGEEFYAFFAQAMQGIGHEALQKMMETVFIPFDVELHSSALSGTDFMQFALSNLGGEDLRKFTTFMDVFAKAADGPERVKIVESMVLARGHEDLRKIVEQMVMPLAKTSPDSSGGSQGFKPEELADLLTRLTAADGSGVKIQGQEPVDVTFKPDMERGEEVDSPGGPSVDIQQGILKALCAAECKRIVVVWDTLRRCSSNLHEAAHLGKDRAFICRNLQCLQFTLQHCPDFAEVLIPDIYRNIDCSGVDMTWSDYFDEEDMAGLGEMEGSDETDGFAIADLFASFFGGSAAPQPSLYALVTAATAMAVLRRLLS